MWRAKKVTVNDACLCCECARAKHLKDFNSPEKRNRGKYVPATFEFIITVKPLGRVHYQYFLVAEVVECGEKFKKDLQGPFATKRGARVAYFKAREHRAPVAVR